MYYINKIKLSMKTIKKPLSALLLSISFLSTWAQVNPQEGYIITLQQDTLRGIIDYRAEQRNTRQCDFKKEGTQEFVTYKPGEIESYSIPNANAFYKTLTTKIDDRDSTIFASCLVRGAMNLYRIANFMNADLFILQKNNGETLTFYEEDGTGNADRAQRRNRLVPVYNMLRDSDRATKRLWKEEINRNTMTQIVRLYNEDVVSGIPTEIFTSSGSSYQIGSGKKNRNYHFVVMGGMSYQRHTTEEGRMTNSTEFTMTGLQPKLSIGVNYNLTRIASGLYVEGFISWSRIGIKKDDVTLPYNMYTSNTYDTKLTGNDLHFEVGPAYRFGKDLKVKPLVRAGIDFNRAFGQEFEAMNISTNYANLFETYYYIDNKQFFFGYYFGIGAAYPLSKGAILLYLDYNDTGTNIPLQCFDVRIGYEF